MKRLILVIAVSIIIFMATTNWGDLAKSQSDPQTIEEMVDAKIADHNSDSTSHLDSGASLATHRAQETLDHPLQSVVRDNERFDRLIVDDYFLNLDTWQTAGDVTVESPGELRLLVEPGLFPGPAALWANSGEYFQTRGFLSTSPNREVHAIFTDAAGFDAYIASGDPGDPAGYGFKIIDGVLSAFYFDNSSTEHSSVISDIDITTIHSYRTEVVYGESVTWKIDGVVVFTIDNTSIANTDLIIFLSMDNVPSGYRYMVVSSVHFDCLFVPN